MKKSVKEKNKKSTQLKLILLVLLLSLIYVIYSSKTFQNIRYDYLISNKELPEVSKTSTIEIDKKTGWYKYTDNIGKFSFIYPIDWEIHNWDDRDPNDWERIIENGMNWDWYINSPLEREFYPLLIIDSNIDENKIGNPFISFHLVANQDLLNENINIVLFNNIDKMSEMFTLNTNDTKIQCPAIKNGTFSCYPNHDIYLKVNSNIFIIRLTGQNNEEMNKVIDSITFF